MTETDWWECPVCHKRITIDDHCEHVYFDSHTHWGPLLKQRTIKVQIKHVGKAKPRSEAEHEQD